MAGGVRMLDREQLLPVTALEFCTISNSVYLLAGNLVACTHDYMIRWLCVCLVLFLHVVITLPGVCVR